VSALISWIVRANWTEIGRLSWPGPLHHADTAFDRLARRTPPSGQET